MPLSPVRAAPTPPRHAEDVEAMLVAGPLGHRWGPQGPDLGPGHAAGHPTPPRRQGVAPLPSHRAAARPSITTAVPCPGKGKQTRGDRRSHRRRHHLVQRRGRPPEAVGGKGGGDRPRGRDARHPGHLLGRRCKGGNWEGGGERWVGLDARDWRPVAAGGCALGRPAVVGGGQGPGEWGIVHATESPYLSPRAPMSQLALPLSIFWCERAHERSACVLPRRYASSVVTSLPLRPSHMHAPCCCTTRQRWTAT